MWQTNFTELFGRSHWLALIPLSRILHLIFWQRIVPLSVPAERKASRANLKLKVILELFYLKFYSNIRLLEAKKGLKRRKASPSPEEPAKKKNKPTAKVTKGRLKGPVDYDKHCGVINDKNLPCSRSLTCKSHSMGAKRAVQGRSRNYDELLLEWQRATNPNFVEPVKRETKAEKKEKREREKLEKKRLASEAAVALGLDPAAVGKKSGTTSSSKKMGKKAAAAAAAAVRLADELRDELSEDLDDLDSEVEVEGLIRSVRVAKENGIIAVPLAVPCDAGSWFIQRRERARCCRDLLLNALGSGGGTGGPGGSISSMGLPKTLGGNTGVRLV